MWNQGTRKYRNKKISHAGYSFASKLEAATFDILKLMEKAGEIKVLQTQANIYLSKAEINYRPDFLIWDEKKQAEAYVESKGFKNPVWAIKLKLYRTYGQKPLWIFEGTYKNPKLIEIVIPKEEI